MEPILNQGYGYGFALGLGAAFAILMIAISKVMSKYSGQVQNSERFSTASRNVGAGLIASSTVSAWTWPATLLVSGTWAYEFGIMGSWMYGVSGTVQITLFVFLALNIKKYAPSAHTVCETFFIRFGKAGHIMYLCYCAATNVIISSLLLLGGSQGFAATTGMPVVAASFLLPLNVIVYTALGGLKATFISDWVHTVIIYLILLVSVYKTYCSSPLIGSPGKMWEMLRDIQEIFPMTTGKSYLSFKSRDMILLPWSITLGGMAAVLGDPGYSQRAIASDSRSVFLGYTMGGLCWWVIPWALGSSAGLACRALLTNPASITFPNELSAIEVDSSMPVIYGLAAIFGKSGAAAGLVMLFMSVTSATSAELIAFSSITTYDIYRTYVNPKATGKQLVRASHIAVMAFGIFMGALSVVFNYIGVTVGWLLSFLGILLNPEVGAVVLCLFWPRMTKLGLLIGAPLGTVTGIVCWLGSTYVYGGHVVNKYTVMTTEATFIGNIVSLFSGIIFIVIFSLLTPKSSSFDLRSLRNAIKAADDVDEEEEKALILTETEEKILVRQSQLSLGVNLFVILGVYVVITCALYGWGGDFSKRSFTAFIVVMMIWLMVAAAAIIFYPLWQGRKTIKKVVLCVLGRQAASDYSSGGDSQSSIIDPDGVEGLVAGKKNSIRITISGV